MDEPSNQPAGTAETFWGVSVDGWQAIGAIATAGAFVVALIAVLIAAKQAKTAREVADRQYKQDRDNAANQLEQNQRAAEAQLAQAREAASEQLKQDRVALQQQLDQAALASIEQSRPYVLLSAELGDLTFSEIDLVLENAGLTAARDVTISVDPPFKRSKSGPDWQMDNVRIFARAIPMLPPKHRLVSFLDSAVERHEHRGELPDEHRVLIEYHDGRGNRYREESTVDLTIWDGLMFGERLGLPEIARSLKSLDKSLSKSKLLGRDPWQVVVEDRDAHASRMREQRTQLQEMHERAMAAQRRAEASTPADEKPSGD